MVPDGKSSWEKREGMLAGVAAERSYLEVQA